MGKSVIFNMSAEAMLDFVGYEFWEYMLFQDLIFSLCIKFGANPFKMTEL